MSDDRRQHYRVTPNTISDVVVEVRLPTGDESRAGLVDISAGGVALAYRKEQAINTSIAEPVKIIFKSDRLGLPLVVDGTVRRVMNSQDGSMILYGVSFESWTGGRSDLTPKLKAMFNEREAVRVEPREEDEVSIEIEINGQPTLIEGTLRDISVLGIGVWVNAESEQTLDSVTDANVKVTLPTGPDDLSMEVEIRHVQVFGERARVGMRFNGTEPVERRHNKTSITQYVMDRQIEAARIDAERRLAMKGRKPTG